MQLVGAGFAGSPSLPAPPPHPGISRGAQTQVHPSQNFSTNRLNPAYPCNPCQAQSLPRNTCLVPWLEPGGVPEIGFPLSFKPRLFLLHTYNLQASTLGAGATVHGDKGHSREGPQGGSIPAPSPPVLDPISLLPHLFFGCAGRPKLCRQPPRRSGEIFCCWLPGGAQWGGGFRGCPPVSKEGLGFLFLRIPQAEPSSTRACCGAVPAGLRPLPGRACVPLISLPILFCQHRLSEGEI